MGLISVGLLPENKQNKAREKRKGAKKSTKMLTNIYSNNRRHTGIVAWTSFPDHILYVLFLTKLELTLFRNSNVVRVIRVNVDKKCYGKFLFQFNSFG